MSLHHRLVPVAFALLAVVTSGIAVFYGYQSQSRAARIAQLEREIATARSEAAKARDTAEKFQTKAAELDTQLGNFKTRATAVETKSAQLNRELASTKSSLTERQQREVALLAEIEALRQKIQTATASAPAGADSPAIVPPSSATVVVAPPTSAASVSSAELSEYRQRIAALESQLTELLTRALAEPLTPPGPAPAPAGTTPAAGAVFKVVRVGAQDVFVIVDVGADHGAQRGDTLLISRGTSVVATVEISDARPRFSVAHVLPAKSKGQLQTGDIVLLAR